MRIKLACSRGQGCYLASDNMTSPSSHHNLAGKHHHDVEMEAEEANEENTVLLKFVEGMLTNFKQLPFERYRPAVYACLHSCHRGWG